MGSLNIIEVVPPVRGQVGPHALVELARQLSGGVHVEGVDVVFLFNRLGCLFDGFGAEVGGGLVLWSFGDEEEPFLFFLLLVVKATIHGSPLVVGILKQLLSVILDVN